MIDKMVAITLKFFSLISRYLNERYSGVTDFILVLMIFLRIIAAFSVTPFYSNTAVPVQVRIFLSIILAYIIFMTIDKTNIHVQISLGWMFINGIKEVLTGVLLGYMINIVFLRFKFCGQLNWFFNWIKHGTRRLIRWTELSDNIYWEIYGFIAMMVFLIINGHHYIITGLFFSFKTIGIGEFVITKPVYDIILKVWILSFHNSN